MSIVTFLDKVNAIIINPILAVVFAVAFIYFVVSVIRLIAADANGKAAAKNAVMWSIVGMFIMFSVYGIINLLLSTFQIDKTSSSYINGKLNGQ